MAKYRAYYRNPRIIGAVAIVVLALVVVLTARGGRHEAEPAGGVSDADPVEVGILTVASAEVADEVSASGTVKPVAESRIAPKIMSNVAAVYVREGDHVRKGQVLVRLESRDLQAQLSQAQAALSAALAGANRASTAVHLQSAQTSAGIANAEAEVKAAREQLSMAREGSRRQQKVQAQLAVAQAEAQYRNAKLELDRMQRLFDQGVIARQRLDSTQTAHDVAKAGYESAKAQADLVEEGSRRQEIRALEERVRQAEENLRLARAASLQNRMSKRSAEEASSQVSQARAAVDFARVQLGYATITSPISGVVTERLVDPGDTVSPGVPVVAVEDDSLYRLEAAAPERDAAGLYVGRMVRVTVGSDERSGEGRVAVVSPAGDPATRKFVVKVDLPKGMRSRSGEFGRISFPVGFSRTVVLPEGALREDGGLTYVFTVGQDKRAKLQVVKTGRKLGGGVEVVSGLAPGDRVIIGRSGSVADGSLVRISEVSDESARL